MNALPLAPLTMSDVSLNFEFSNLMSCLRTTGSPLISITNANYITPQIGVQLYVDFVYLGNTERSIYMQNAHEYLIETMQFTGDQAVVAPSSSVGTTSRRFQLNYANPVKELLFAYVSQARASTNTLYGNDSLNFTNPVDTGKTPTVECFDSVQMFLNGAERFSTRPGAYFRLVQPLSFHDRVPVKPFIYMYAFGVRPDDVFPSGHINMSRFSSMEVLVNLNAFLPNGTIKFIPRTWNILRIADGQGAVAFVS